MENNKNGGSSYNFMCLGVPGKIVKIDGDIATIDYGVEKRKATLLEYDYCIGDYVLVQAKIVVMKVSENEAKEALKLYNNSLDGI